MGWPGGGPGAAGQARRRAGWQGAGRPAGEGGDQKDHKNSAQREAGRRFCSTIWGFCTIPVAISELANFMAALIGQGPFYKVGVLLAREATFGAERIVLAVLGKYVPRKFAEKHGRVAKK